MSQSGTEQAFNRSRYFSTKYDSYFPVYDRVFSPYRGRPIVFVEVGVLSGGSLFMWRDYFGDQARIIGVDLNPEAAKWREHGFEIHIGDQSQEQFWSDFFAVVGPVDILVDDGGHRNHQQISTTACALPHIKDGGLLLVEDVHTSYMRKFGNPSARSFISYCKEAVDSINARSPYGRGQLAALRTMVHSIEFFESIVVFKINRSLCATPKFLTNDGIADSAQDFRDVGTFDAKLASWFGRINTPEHSVWIRTGARAIYFALSRYSTYRKSRTLDRYFE
jgi:Methyltransferase domain